MRNRIRVLCLAGCMWLVPVMLLAGDVNFSGHWTLNIEKSKLSEGRRRGMAATRLQVTQSGNDMTIVRTFERRDQGAFDMTEKLTLDGKECKNTFRDNPRISVVKWGDDKKTLIITTTMTFSRGGNEFRIDVTEKWRLDEQGCLVIDSKSVSPRGERTRKFVYDPMKK